MPIRLIVARTSADKDQVFQLRHRVFVEEEQRFASSAERVFDRFDCLNETLNLLAFDGDSPVATIRITLENSVGLPCCEHYDFTSVVAGLNGKCASIGWLCCKKSHRQHPGLVAGMLKLAVRKIRQAGNRHMIATIHPPILPILAAFGAKPVGDVFQAGSLAVPMQPIYADLENLRPGAREVFADPLNFAMDESDERRIYARGEVIVQKGEVAETGFLVMRGSVRVPCGEPGGKDLLFGQGQLFGELSLLDGGPRTTTVVAHSKEVDVMAWSRTDFMAQLCADRDRAFELCKILAGRLRRNIEGTIQTAPTSLLARILLDASRGGALPVNADWLSRQCGVWLDDLDSIVSSWCERGWVKKDGCGLCVTNAAEVERLTAL